jgi:hypothetical protein
LWYTQASIAMKCWLDIADAQMSALRPRSRVANDLVPIALLDPEQNAIRGTYDRLLVTPFPTVCASFFVVHERGSLRVV